MDRITPHDISKLKGSRKITCLTAYTTPMAALLDPYVDVILVGDSVGMVLYGFETTLDVTIEMMALHGAAVMRGSARACVVVDMPYGSYEECPALATENARYLLEKTGAAAVKLEGGVEMAGQIRAMVAAGVPVMGHIGLQPQSVVKEGGYKIKGRTEDELERIVEDAVAVEKAGAFALVVEGTVPALAERITRATSVPTIGIGASGACDGQVLVSEDMLGLSGGYVPKFVKHYAQLDRAVETAVKAYVDDVRSGAFPAEEHLYK
jgi:3-methyl-2-oxobutanoate hydroxymethyltransferase